MNEEQHFAQTLRELRQSYGVSQNKLAVAAGYSRQTINQIENGRTQVKPHKQEALLKVLEYMNPDAPMTMLFDYVRIRFPTTKAREVIEQILHLKFDFMLHLDYAFYSYQEQWVLGDIVVMLSQEISKGVLLELKGRGCRQYENFLLAQKRSWFDFFKDCLEKKAVIKRLNLAINDRTGILDIPELARKCKNEECVSIFRSFKNYRSGELVWRDEKLGMGNTLYIGSLKSEVYFCLYEKDYEQYVKLSIPIEEAKIKNRFEIRLKNDRALHALRDLLKHNNPEKTAFGIIKRYMRFAEKEPDKRRSAWKTNEQWLWFIGKNREEVRLTSAPEPYTVESTYRWLGRQIAPTLKMCEILDRLKKTNRLQEIMDHAELSERHEKIIEQQVAAIEDMII